jgi:hypothetical protein
MPPDKGKLISDDELQTIHDWLASGAQTARPEPETLDAAAFITEEERSHWSFQPIGRPPVPQVENRADVANPIDAFLLAELEKHGLAFSPQAADRVRIRRAYLDLHGLPPTPEALTVSVKGLQSQDPSQGWAAFVEDLLQSPLYGQRWAQHWLDVAGYSDSEGYTDNDTERAHAWRYRDYVIRALNADKPFDIFIREQLAGDELVTSPPGNLSEKDSELLVATGFLRMAPDGTGGAVVDNKLSRNDTIADTIHIVSSSLMGMTIGCAQCHDHRYDPISQADYYRFRAIFEPAFDWEQWRTPTERLVSLYSDEDRAAAVAIELEAVKIDIQRSQRQAEFIDATFEEELGKLPEALHASARSAHRTLEKDRTNEQRALIKKHPSLNVTAGSLYLYNKKAADELQALATKAQDLRATKPSENFVHALTEVAGRVPTTKLFHRGDHEQPKQELEPAGLTVISLMADVPNIPHNSPDLPTTGRRLALAQRLTDPQHPLTSRVIVNRIWRHHFGRGLVETTNDFGLLGQAPSHPALLDWLASELMSNDWSLKHIHRLILTSNAWQQTVRDNPVLERLDPDNQWYGGTRLRRLDAEVIRDCMLSVAGKLNSKEYGPPVPVMADRVGRFVIGQENLNAGRPGDIIDMQGDEFRRSIFIQARRSRPLAILEAFDRPAMTPNCDIRRPTTASTQSLLMLNSDLLLEYSRFMAARLELEVGSHKPAQINRAWNLAYARSPDKTELQSSLEFLDDQAAIFSEQVDYQPSQEKPPVRSAQQEALAVLCQTLLSSNEFLYVD